MKNKILTCLAMAATMLLSCILSSSTPIKKLPPSTCGPYTIFNDSGCSIKITYQRTCNGVPCGPLVNTGIAPNSQIVLPACPCGGMCNVVVTLDDVNGSAAGLPVTVSGTGTTSAGYPASSCPGSLGNFFWFPTYTTVY